MLKKPYALLSLIGGLFSKGVAYNTVPTLRKLRDWEHVQYIFNVFHMFEDISIMSFLPCVPNASNGTVPASGNLAVFAHSLQCFYCNLFFAWNFSLELTLGLCLSGASALISLHKPQQGVVKHACGFGFLFAIGVGLAGFLWVMRSSHVIIPESSAEFVQAKAKKCWF